MRLDLEQFNHYDGGGCHLTVQQDDEGEGRIDLVVRLESATEGWHGTFPLIREDGGITAGLEHSIDSSRSVARLQSTARHMRRAYVNLRDAIRAQDHPVVVRQLTPDEARELAASLVHHANETERKYGR